MIPEVGQEGGALQGPPGQSEEGMWGGAGLSSGGEALGRGELIFSSPGPWESAAASPQPSVPGWWGFLG